MSHISSLGLNRLESRPELTATTERISAPLAAERLAAGGIVLLDVRTPTERGEKSISGSIGVPQRLLQGLDNK